MKVLIFEPLHSGHHYEYLSRMVRAVAELKVDLTVATTRRGLESSEFQIHVQGLRESYALWECRDVLGLYSWRRRHTIAAELYRAIQEIKPDHILVPCGDPISKSVTLYPRFGRPQVFVEGLHFGGGVGYALPTWKRRLKSWTYGRFLANTPWSVWSHLDPWQVQTLCRRYPHLKKTALLMPDPVDPAAKVTKAEARKVLGLPQVGWFIGCAGPMSKRKGSDLLLHAFASAAPALASEARLLLAGKFDADIRQLLRGDFRLLLQQDRIIVIDRHLSQQEMDLAIPAMDIVCAPYPAHMGSSGIALRAAANERPILATDRFWLRQVVQTFRLGQCCNVLDREAFAQAIRQAFVGFHEFELTPQARRYLQFQSVPNFMATWTLHLRQRLGMDPDPRRIPWPWVFEESEHPISCFPK